MRGKFICIALFLHRVIQSGLQRHKTITEEEKTLKMTKGKKTLKSSDKI